MTCASVNAPPESYDTRIHALLTSACYHYSDDTAQEWGIATREVNEAVNLMIDASWSLSHFRQFIKGSNYLIEEERVLSLLFRRLQEIANATE